MRVGRHLHDLWLLDIFLGLGVGPWESVATPADVAPVCAMVFGWWLSNFLDTLSKLCTSQCSIQRMGFCLAIVQRSAQTGNNAGRIECLGLHQGQFRPSSATASYLCAHACVSIRTKSTLSCFEQHVHSLILAVASWVASVTSIPCRDSTSNSKSALIVEYDN